jgi:hypothetical protein
MSIVSWHIIGGSSNDQARRQVGWTQFFGRGLSNWPGFIKGIVMPAADKFREQGRTPRLVLGNPFGTLAAEPMQFDQWWHAANTPWLRDGFTEAWLDWKRDNPDAEVICYLGTLDKDASFNLQADNWLYRFYMSIRPALDAGMSIGWDASAVVPEDAPAGKAIQLIRSLGHTCYVEARPNQAYLAGWPVIAIDTTFERSDPDLYPDAEGNLPNAKLGPVMLLINGTDPANRQDRIKQWAGMGYDLAVFPDDLEFAFGYVE